MQEHTFTIAEELDGTRLDKALSSLLAPMSRSRVQGLILQECVTINGRGGKWGSSKVRQDMVVTITIPEPDNLEIIAEDIPLDIVFEDEHLAIVNKASDMVVHPASGNFNGTLVNALMFHFGDKLAGIGGVKRPGIVHRIDKDTSGLLVVAKNDQAHTGLTKLFKDHDIERIYTAYVWGSPAPLNGKIDAPVGRNKKDRKKMAVLSETDKTAKHAITHYQTTDRYRTIATKIECKLETGRTHQIRVHMTNHGNALIGDPTYGRMPNTARKMMSEKELEFFKTFNRQALHAKTLGFIHPVTGEKLHFEAPMPQELLDLDKLLNSFKL